MPEKRAYEARPTDRREPAGWTTNEVADGRVSRQRSVFGPPIQVAGVENNITRIDSESGAAPRRSSTRHSISCRGRYRPAGSNAVESDSISNQWPVRTRSLADALRKSATS